AGEIRRFVADMLDLADDGIFRSVLDDAPLVLGDRAEGAAAKTTALDGYRETDHLVRGYIHFTAFALVLRMRTARIRQFVYAVHLLRRQRDRRRVQPNIVIAVALNQCARVSRVRLHVQDARGVRVQHRISCDLLVGGQTNEGLLARETFDLADKL